MKIETKFNICDGVWFLKDNVVVEAIVSSVTTFTCGTNQDSITYTAKKIEHSVSWLDYTNLHERNLFPTKEALLASL